MTNHLECNCKYAKRIFSDDTKVLEQCEFLLENNIGAVGDRASRYPDLIKSLNNCLEKITNHHLMYYLLLVLEHVK